VAVALQKSVLDPPNERVENDGYDNEDHGDLEVWAAVEDRHAGHADSDDRFVEEEGADERDDLADEDNDAPDGQLQEPDLVVEVGIWVGKISLLVCGYQVDVLSDVHTALEFFDAIFYGVVVKQSEQGVVEQRAYGHITPQIHEVPDAAVPRVSDYLQVLGEEDVEGVTKARRNQLLPYI